LVYVGQWGNIFAVLDYVGPTLAGAANSMGTADLLGPTLEMNKAPATGSHLSLSFMVNERFRSFLFTGLRLFFYTAVAEQLLFLIFVINHYFYLGTIFVFL
jgi:hypothetical protein